jgi:hypothetical protein
MKTTVLRILLLLALFSGFLTAFAGQSYAGTRTIDERLREIYPGEWEILDTEKSHNETYDFYQRDTVYKAPGFIIYMWSRSYSQKDDETDFDHYVMGYASSSNFNYVHDIADGIAPGMSSREVNRAFEKNAEWFNADGHSTSTLLDEVKSIPGEKKNTYFDVATMAGIVVSFKNGKAYFVEYFNDGDRDDPERNWGRVFINAIEEMKRHEWEKPFNEWVFKAKSGQMELISGGWFSVKDTRGQELPVAFCGTYYGAGPRDEAAFVTFADIPGNAAAPHISGDWLTLKNGASYPEYSVNISRKNNKETVSFRKSLGPDELWTIDCGRSNQPYREYRNGTVAVFRELTANGNIRFWLADIAP